MHTFQNLLLISCLVACFSASSAIYKCEIDGVLTFSDQPCSDNYEKIEVTPQVIKTRPAKSAKTDSSETDNYVESRKLKRDIEQVKARIKKLQNSMDAEIANVKNMTVRTANNLYGASRSEALAMQMNVITERYQAQIAAEQNTLNSLQQSLNAIERKSSKAASNNEHKQTLNRIGNYADNRAIDREIRNNQNKIKRLQKELDDEIDTLKQQSSKANNNLAGATWQKSIAQEMAAINKQYQIKISALSEENSRLREQKQQRNQNSNTQSEGY